MDILNVSPNVLELRDLVLLIFVTWVRGTGERDLVPQRGRHARAELPTPQNW